MNVRLSAQTKLRILSAIQSKFRGIRTMASNIINGGAKPNPISIGPLPIATFTDGADGAPIPSLKFYIEPKQDLHGYSNTWTGGGGSNIWDEEWERGRLVFDKNDANWGQNAASDTAIRSKNYVPITPDASYYGKFASGATAYAIFYDSNKSPVLYGTSGYKSIANQSFTAPATAYYMRFYVQSTTEYANNIAINYPSTVTTYSPYSNICPITGWTAIDGRKSGADTSDYTSIPLTIPGTPGTVYGGYWDVVNGKLYARPYIASYSGQALVGPWVSSHDKYVSGGTPTTGAQVVDMGGTLTEYSVTPITNLSTLLGVNNIWCDSGDTTVGYVSETLQNPTGFPALPFITLEMTDAGVLNVGGKAWSIGSYNGTLYCDSENMDWYDSTQLQNSLVTGDGFPVLEAGDTSVYFSGGISSITIDPRWRAL